MVGPGLAAAHRSLCHAAGSHVTLRSREKTTYRPQVATTASVYSNIKITPEQIAWLLNQFEALQEHSGAAWTIEVGPGVTDVVSVADGTSDLALHTSPDPRWGGEVVRWPTAVPPCANDW